MPDQLITRRILYQKCCLFYKKCSVSNGLINYLSHNYFWKDNVSIMEFLLMYLQRRSYYSHFAFRAVTFSHIHFQQKV